jgi:hypothetical protein
VRPRLVHEVVPFLQNHLQVWKYFDSTKHNGGPLVSPQLLILVLEVLLVCPTVLAVLPFTRQLTLPTSSTPAKYTDTDIHDNKNGNGNGKPTDNNSPSPKDLSGGPKRPGRNVGGGGLRRVLRILEGSAWFLWTLAAIVFLMGIFDNTKMFGVISFSALLALFAQGIQAVKLIGSHRLDREYSNDLGDEYDDVDDLMLSPSTSPHVLPHPPRSGTTRSVSQNAKHQSERNCLSFLYTVPRRRASLWAQDNTTCSTTEAKEVAEEKKEENNHNRQETAKMKHQPSSSAVMGSSGEKLDFMIFFLVSSCLLMSPYYLHVCFQFIFKACLGCVQNRNNLQDNMMLMTDHQAQASLSDTTNNASDQSILGRLNATLHSAIPLLFQQATAGSPTDRRRSSCTCTCPW